MKPFKRVTLPFLATQLTLTEAEVESLCIDMILDERIDGLIDQINRVLTIHKADSKVLNKYRLMNTWVAAIEDLKGI